MKAFEGRPPVEYPRKRASIACNFCRHRKRKCDGQKPTCGLCADAGAQCEYQESDRVQDIPAEILLRLSHMETLLQQQKEAIAELSTRVTSQADPLIYLPNVSAHLAQPRYNWYPSPGNTYHDRSSISLPPQQNHEEPLPIPLGHSTPTERLFFLDRIKNLIGEYPQDFFMQLESTRLPKFEDKSVNTCFDRIDPTLFQARITEPYFNEFLINVHAFFPLMEPLALRTVYENFTLVPRGNSIQTILCLVIIALGKVSSNPGHIFDIEAADDRNGIEYFAPAYHELKNRWSAFLPMNRSPFVPLAFVYASLYFRYIGRPFQASNMITDASTAVKSLHSLLSVKPMMREHDTLFRTTWACYILECDDLAEFNFPRSGIEFLVEGPPSVEGGMHFPRLSEPTERSNLVFLAMCSIRKLLNRVHTWIYDPTFLDNYAAASPSQQKSHSTTPHPQKHSIASLERICVELNRQLEEWFQSLPPQIRPDLKKPMSHQDAYDSYIRARYYATKHIIYRPSLVYAAQNKDNNVLPDYVFGNCKQCIASCRKFVEAASLLLEKRTHSNWLRMQALLAAIFTLATAKSTPSLEAIVSDFDFDQLMKEAIQSIGLWAQHSESADAILSIIKTIRQKIRLSVSRA